MKFSDDTIILSLLTVDTCPSVYFKEVASFHSWCEDNHLILNPVKTKKLIFDPKHLLNHDPVVIGDSVIEQVESVKYLGVHIDNLLKWNVHVVDMCKKLSQRLHFLRRLRLFGVSPKIMTCFYNAVLQSLIRYGMVAWFGSLSVQCKNKIEKLVKSAMKTIGTRDYPSLQSIFESSVLAQAKSIISQPFHLLYKEYELLPSGRRYRAVRHKSNRFKFSFIPTSVALLNKNR